MAIKEITTNEFKDEVINSEKPVLVDFNANWCGPCKMLKPILEDLSESKKEIKIVSVNIDDEDELAENYEVYSIPCLVLFKNGKEDKRSVGFMPKDEVEKFLGE